MSLGIKSSAFLRVEHPFAQKFEVQMCIFLNIKFLKVMEFCLKLVHMAQYELILTQVKGYRYMAQDHFKTPPDPNKGHVIIKNPHSRAGQVMSFESSATLRVHIL